MSTFCKGIQDCQQLTGWLTERKGNERGARTMNGFRSYKNNHVSINWQPATEKGLETLNFQRGKIRNKIFGVMLY